MAVQSSEGGLKTAGLSLEGWYDRGDIDLAQFESLGNDGSAMIAPAGQTAGDVAYVVPYAANAWEPGASVGELMAFTFAGEGDGEPVRAQVFDVREGVTALTSPPPVDSWEPWPPGRRWKCGYTLPRTRPQGRSRQRCAVQQALAGPLPTGGP